MRKIWGIIVIPVAIFFMAGCTPEFDQNAEFKDITVVYGLLNPSEETHYLKIYKGYLTSDNAIAAAKDLDNISYYDDIKVFLEEYNEKGKLVKTLDFTSTCDVPKDSGIFAYNPQVIYQNKEKLNQNSTYQLHIVNRKTGKHIYAKTPLVQDFKISTQNPYDIAYFLLSKSPSALKFSVAKNAKAYDITLKFRYIEVDKKSGDTITPNGLISWYIKRVPAQQGGTSIETKCNLNQFYEIVAKHLKKNPNVIRYIAGHECIDIEIAAAEEAFVTYLDINAADANSIVQNRANYTNIVSDDNSAFGIFSSRNFTKKTYKLQNANDKALEDSLVYGSKTKHLGFKKLAK